jgi:hypothetical protein
MTGAGTQVTGASFVSTPSPDASLVSSEQLAGFPRAGSSFAILSTGQAAAAYTPNTTGDTGTDFGGGLVRGDTDYDVTILKVDVDVPPTANCLLGVDFRFLSEEYPEWVGTQFNDAFIAEVDQSTWTTYGSQISAPGNFAFDEAGNPITINAAGASTMTEANAAGTTYDGGTTLLSAAAPLTPGPHSLYFSLFDQGDGVWDSTVLLDNIRIGAVPDPADCRPGARAVVALTTVASPGGVLGGQLSDTATLAGGASPTGTLTFRLYGPNDESCTGTPVFTSTVPVSGNGDYPSAAFTPTAPGTYRWAAAYSGDTNNAALTGACNDPGESVAITAAVVTLTTTASPGVVLGGHVSDTATLAGGIDPTGTITYRLYDPNDESCAGAPVFTSTVPVSGNGDYPSVAFTPTATGTYRWIASYTGDTNDNPLSGACNDPGQSVVVTATVVTAGDLPVTGTDIRSLTLMAAGLLALGGLLVVVTRGVFRLHG